MFWNNPMVKMATLALLLACFLAGAMAHALPPQDSPTSPDSKPSPVSIDEDRPINWKTLVPDVLQDQKAIWTFPGALARGDDWKPTLVIGGAVAGLIALDPHDTPYFRTTSSFSGFNRRVSGTNALIGTALVPVTAYAVGLVRHDSYATHTALLAGEAAVDAGVLGWVMQTATGRLAPQNIAPGGSYSDTWFKTYHPILHAGGSFPSEHTIAAFSVATVFARRYGRHRWVPWVAYGAATLVGFSRVTLQAHFPSDVFAGGALAYMISRFAVMPGREPEP